MKYRLALLPLMISMSVNATIPAQQWKCMALDSKEQNYTGAAITIENAMSKAIEQCKKSTHQAGTCRTAQSFCSQEIVNEDEDRCIVTDSDGHTWDTDGEDACKTAMSMCNRFIYLESGAHGNCAIKYGGTANGNLDVD